MNGEFILISLVPLLVLIIRWDYLSRDEKRPDIDDAACKKTTRLTALYYRDGSFAGWFNLNKKQ